MAELRLRVRVKIRDSSQLGAAIHTQTLKCFVIINSLPLYKLNIKRDLWTPKPLSKIFIWDERLMIKRIVIKSLLKLLGLLAWVPPS